MAKQTRLGGSRGLPAPGNQVVREASRQEFLDLRSQKAWCRLSPRSTVVHKVPQLTGREGISSLVL